MTRKRVDAVDSEWHVRIQFFNYRGKHLRTLVAKSPIRAVNHAHRHLVIDEYGAHKAEVFSARGKPKPYASFVRTPQGVQTRFRCPVKDMV